MMSHRKPKHRREAETTDPVTPEISGDDGRKDETPERENVEVQLVLKLEELVLFQIRGIGCPRMHIGNEDHPAQMIPPEASVSVVWIEVGVCVAMMGTMRASPPIGGALNRASTGGEEEQLKRNRRVVRAVGPVAMISCNIV